MKSKQFISRTFLFVMLSCGGIIFVSCKKDKNEISEPPLVENEPEVITTVKLIFSDSSNIANVKYATYRDPDGDGGAVADIFDTIKLESNKTWLTQLIILNETVSPVDTISKEILSEGVDHLFCFTPGGVSATVTKTDLDANNLPIGLQSKWKTGAVGLGTMQIQLKHQPGTKDGSCNPGNTDVDVTFQVKVQ